MGGSGVTELRSQFDRPLEEEARGQHEDKIRERYCSYACGYDSEVLMNQNVVKVDYKSMTQKRPDPRT